MIILCKKKRKKESPIRYQKAFYLNNNTDENDNCINVITDNFTLCYLINSDLVEELAF